jgi:Anaphase-promoting complex subunit 11 RING-H2 finger
MEDTAMAPVEKSEAKKDKPEKMFTLKKWNAVAMWSWDVECDTCAICRIQVMGKCFKSSLKVLCFDLDMLAGECVYYFQSFIC